MPSAAVASHFPVAGSGPLVLALRNKQRRSRTLDLCILPKTIVADFPLPSSCESCKTHPHLLYKALRGSFPRASSSNITFFLRLQRPILRSVTLSHLRSQSLTSSHSGWRPAAERILTSSSTIMSSSSDDDRPLARANGHRCKSRFFC